MKTVNHHVHCSGVKVCRGHLSATLSHTTITERRFFGIRTQRVERADYEHHALPSSEPGNVHWSAPIKPTAPGFTWSHEAVSALVDVCLLMTRGGDLDTALRISQSKQEVSVQMGWAWTCPSCKHHNFSQGEVPDDVVKDIQAATGDPSLTTNELTTRPEEVTCADCLTSYPVEPPASVDDED